jgi:hypothetical protein
MLIIALSDTTSSRTNSDRNLHVNKPFTKEMMIDLISFLPVENSFAWIWSCWCGKLCYHHLLSGHISLIGL